MKRWLPLLLGMFFTTLVIAQGIVDLDAPGALDKLKREQPDHYLKLVDALQKARVTPYIPKDPALNARKPVQTGQPADAGGAPKTKMIVPVEGAQYRITVVGAPK